MFPFDPSLLPQLPTRKAFIAIDFQVDFFPPSDVAVAGVYNPKLPIVHPASPGTLVGRVLDLAHRFRASGNVVCWVESAYHSARPAEKELPKPPDVATRADRTSHDAKNQHGRKSEEGAKSDGGNNSGEDGRDRGGGEIAESDPYPDAFLSPGPARRPLCVQPSTPGASLHPLIERTLASCPRDLCITKTHYSAFKCPAFLQRLRVSFVTELFVCGSITNAGVYATAIEAAGHGYAITLVDDCCGWTDKCRRDAAVRDLEEITGCEVLDYDEVIKVLSNKPDKKNITVKKAEELDETMAKLSITGKYTSNEPEADETTQPVSSPPSPTYGESGQKKLMEDCATTIGCGETYDPNADKNTEGEVDVVGQDGPGAKHENVEEKVGAAGKTRGLGEGEQSGVTVSPLPVTSRGDEQLKYNSAVSTADKDAPEQDEATPNPATSDYPAVKAGSAEPAERDDSIVGQPSCGIPVPEAESTTCLALGNGDGQSVEDTHTPAAITRQLPRPPRASPERSSVSEPSSERCADGQPETSMGMSSESSPNEYPTLAPGYYPSTLSKHQPEGSMERPQEPEPEGPPKSSSKKSPKSSPEKSQSQTLNVPICEGDTIIIPSVLSPPLADTVYDTLLAEVKWNRMSHQGGEVPRRVAVQGTVDPIDGSIPVYRHPADASPTLLPITASVLAIKQEVEKRLGHEVNHVLIQHYQTGYDFISEHSDKTLDIVRGSYICNVSLGAERTMVFRSKKTNQDTPQGAPNTASTNIMASERPASPLESRVIVRAKLPHNSLCKMGLRTNMKWLHAIRPDKRMDLLKSCDELAYNGGRISLTFRRIGTFLSADESVIWGQGATSKSRKSARPVINGQGPETVRMLHAFGTENRASDFDWDAYYGQGFDVLHMRTAPRLFTSIDPIANMRVALMLAECHIGYAKGSGTGISEPGFTQESSLSQFLQSRPIKFCDADTERTTVEGDVSILWYLDSHHSKASRGRHPSIHAKQLTALEHGVTLLHQWRALKRDEVSGKRDVKLIWPRLTLLENTSAESGFVVEGDGPSVADFAIWPVLHVIVGEIGADETFTGTDKLRRFYNEFKSRSSVVSVLARAKGT